MAFMAFMSFLIVFISEQGVLLELVSKTIPAGLGVFPQGLKPAFLLALDGVAQATPLQSIIF